ncbi:MAG: hypothetical protein ACYTG0_05030 [Planctomycetota bacterium]|jgi:hypothetical protein
MCRSKRSSAGCAAAVVFLTVALCGLKGECASHDAPQPAPATVRITRISASRGVVEGEVANLPGPVGEYVVAVYVKTDDWYIHPFTGSTAPIGENGQWRIDHVLRGGEQQLGAVVMQRSAGPPAPRLGSLGGLPAVAKTTVPYQRESETKLAPPKRESDRRARQQRRPVDSPPPARAKGPSVRITRISASGGVIEGEVANLPGLANDYVVAVYVKTDDWYIHPFTGSTAPIGENGQWRIDHVLRGGEQQLAAVVLRRSADPPAPRLGSLDPLPAVAKTTVPYQREYEPPRKPTEREGTGRQRPKQRHEAPTPPARAKGPSVRITRISASGGVIEGEAANLPGPTDDYVVAVYVKTDDWYIHPFTGSTAPIGENGQWRIDHVLRGGEQQLGAVVLRRSADPPAPRLGSLGGLTAVAKTTVPYQREYEPPRKPTEREGTGRQRPKQRHEAPTPPASAKGPSVRITRISASGGVIEGEAANLPGPTDDYVVAVYVKTDDWYVHPFTGLTAPIGENGQWRIDHVARGGEQQLGAVVLRRSTDPPASRLGSLGGLTAVANTSVPYRPEYEATPLRPKSEDPSESTSRGGHSRTVEFARRKWTVKHGMRLGPGPNAFSQHEGMVWVDAEGLHLTIDESDGQWQCSEVVAPHSMGYGEYRATICGDLPRLDARAVLGVFLYENDRCEIDFELARWGQPNNENSQFVVQPAAQDSMHRFDAGKAKTLTVSLYWESSLIRSRCWIGDDTSHEPIADWSYRGPKIPEAGRERMRFNFWLLGGLPPESRERQEVIIRSFDFKPLDHAVTESSVSR